jgi:hypothetical protein
MLAEPIRDAPYAALHAKVAAVHCSPPGASRRACRSLVGIGELETSRMRRVDKSAGPLVARIV